ncbi:DUF6953 family protein [Hyphomicrobium sp.]|uniref:DUF6953 family protein n=1 Tax=Hyphomicrobium sp. TaxID=82 RepID=UPI002FDFEA88
MTDPGHSADDVAKWMMEQIGDKKPLYQDDAAWKIMRQFGKSFVYDNAAGNPAIEKAVLDAFRKVSGDDIVWSKGEKCWRKRIATDVPGRAQD